LSGCQNRNVGYRTDNLLADESLAGREPAQARDFIMQRLDAWAKRFTKSELVEQAQALHFPASPVSTTLDLVTDPQLITRGYLTPVDHPEFCRIPFAQGADCRHHPKAREPCTDAR
jgi:crotonobetainyl-CoA:carnitine CoA-transferase CaiB-like acyl-CoA transferase